MKFSNGLLELLQGIAGVLFFVWFLIISPIAAAWFVYLYFNGVQY